MPSPRRYRGVTDFGRAGDIGVPNYTQNWGGFNPNYHEWFEAPGSEGGGGERRARLRPDIMSRLTRNGRTYGQVGPAGANDDSLIEWDDEFGWITPEDNIRWPENDWFVDALPYIFAATVGGASGGFGAFGGESAGGFAGAEAGGGLGGGSLGGSLGGGLGGLSGLARLGGNGLSILSRLLGGGANGANGRNGRSGGMPGLLDLLLRGGLQFAGDRQDSNDLDRFRGDIDRMVDVGTAGVTNEDRRPFRDLVRGLYDGSISGDEIFNRVPGLRAQSERGAEDIARRWSAAGESSPYAANPHAMREWVNYNNELTSRAWNDEMNRAGRWAGLDFNPGQMAGRGLEALAQYYQGRRGLNQGRFSGLDDILSQLLGGGAGGLGGLLGALGRLFNGDEGTPWPEDYRWDDIFGGDDETPWPDDYQWGDLFNDDLGLDFGAF